MTGYTVNTGSTTKFSEGWDRIFGGSAKTSDAKAASKTGRAPAKSSTSKKTSRQKKAQKTS